MNVTHIFKCFPYNLVILKLILHFFIQIQIKLLESEKNDLKLKLKELESASASDGSLAPAQQTAETKGNSKKFIANDT